jgi:hypothetical protein
MYEGDGGELSWVVKKSCWRTRSDINKCDQKTGLPQPSSKPFMHFPYDGFTGVGWWLGLSGLLQCAGCLSVCPTSSPLFLPLAAALLSISHA